MNLPAQYEWLSKEIGPASLLEALKHYGLQEIEGKESNPEILAFAKALHIDWYTNDDTAWCGLAEGYTQFMAGFPFDRLKLLSALSWAEWGDRVDLDKAMLGDTLVFKRPGGGHVAKYIGESQFNFLIYGGNQSNKWGFEWISKDRLFAVRRAHWKIKQPSNIRKIHLSADGAVLAQNEA